MRLKRRTLLGATAASIALTGCLGDDDEGTDETTTPDDDSTDDGMAMDGEDEETNDDEMKDDDPTVGVRDHPDHGEILVGPDEMTLYMFDPDEKGEPESSCYDGCAESWPPLTVESEPTAGDGVTADLTTFERDDGSMQVAANGWPLYYFAPDEEPGDVEGQGANDVWWVLEPDGTPIKPESDDESGEPTVQVREHSDHGEILVGPDEMTLYMFDPDEQGVAESTCYDGCAESWPPLTVDGDPVAGDGVAADLTTFERETGETQVAAGGWPLYYFAPDEEPGDVEGQGANDVWWVLEPDGTPIKPTEETEVSGGY